MSEQWDQIKEILGSALERSPEERSEYVRQACAHDESLRAEVESLLSHYDGADSLLEGSPAAELFPSAAGLMIGKTVGAYRILSEIGQGGMATVYLAERADQEYRRQVAIKMVRPGVSSEEMIRRFRHERQTLAALDHPHIVKLLDGGTTEEGWPYLVMDYVDGLPVDQYCDRQRLSISERLALFRSICAAVDYAHRRKVIHRDIKPGNILMTKEGEPRLLDFGIAKLLDPEWLQTSQATTRDRRPMTPEYASPEQVRGEPITAATDVYSLGVLLYELLTGHRLYSAARHSWPEIQRLVCEADPPRPSKVVDQTSERIVAARSASVPELRRCLQGDLDTIVLMALRKEPQRRYESVEQLSNDLERYLAGRPVAARRPTLLYRSTKFLKRHVEAAAALAVAVTLMAGVSVWQARRSGKGKPSAPAATRPSVAILGFKNLSGREDAAWLSTAFSEMLATELSSGGKLRLVPGETVARARIDLALTEAESFGPATLQRVRQDLGGDYVVAGSYLELASGARAPLRLDLRLQDTASGETLATVSETGTEDGLVAVVARAGSDLRKRFGVAEVTAAESSRIQAAAPSNPEALRLYAQGLEQMRRFDALGARDLLSRAVAADPNFSLGHSALAQAWQTLGYDARASEESKKAMELANGIPSEDRLLVEARYAESTLNWAKAMEMYQSLFSVFPDTREYGLYLATAQTRAGRGKDAMKTLATMAHSGADAADDPRIDLAISEAASTMNDARTRRDAADRAAVKASRQGAKLLVARARAQECRALADLGEDDKAPPVCEEGRRIYQEAGDLAGLSRVLHSMAEGPLNRDDLVTAEGLYRRALALAREVGDRRAIARELGNLALIFKKRGDLATARTMMEDALKNATETDDQNSVAVQTNNIGNLLLKQARFAEGLQYYQRSLKAATRGGDQSMVAIPTENIGDTQVEMGDLAEGLRHIQQANSLYASLGKKSYYAVSLVLWGQALEHQGDVDGARRKFVDALAVMEQLKDRGSAAETRTAMAELDCNTGRAAEAEPLARAAADELGRLNEPDSQIQAQAVLVRALLQQNKLAEARGIVQETFRRSQQSSEIRARFSGALIHARWNAADGNPAEGEREARQVLEEARKLGFAPFELEASLVLGEIQLKGKTPAAGHARLQELAARAGSQGFGLMARQAAALQ